jgi:hypothetical protein
MAGIDGDDEHLMLKVNKSLNQRMGLVKRGTVMHLTVFIPIEFCHSDPTDFVVSPSVFLG